MPRISPTDYKTQLKVFGKVGFTHVRTRGDHLILEKIGSPRPVVIPKYKEVPVFIIKNNFRSAGLSRNQYLKLLKEI